MRTKKQYKDVDQYINSFPKEVVTRLQTIRAIIKKAAPKAEETISYSMPAYKQNGVLVYFAGYPNHVGLYPFPLAAQAFRKELSKYKTGKGSIQLPHDKPLPLTVIRNIVKYRLKERLAAKKK